MTLRRRRPVWRAQEFARKPDELEVATAVTRRVTGAESGLSRHFGAS